MLVIIFKLLGYFLITFIGMLPIFYFLFLNKTKKIPNNILNKIIYSFYTNLLFIFIYFLDNFNCINKPTLFTVLPLLIALCVYIDKRVTMFYINTSLFFLLLSNSNNFILIFISFEFVFLITLLQPILSLSLYNSNNKIKIITNILKWNLPSSILGVYIIYFILSKYSIAYLPFLYKFENNLFYFLLILYILSKMTLWPLFALKYKIYELSNFKNLFFLNYTYFILLQVIIIPSIVSIKISPSLFIIITVLICYTSILLSIKTIFKINEFVIITSFISYLNFIFLMFI